MRKPLKALGEVGLVRLGFAALSRALSRRHSIVLAFHNVVPDDAPSVGDASLHVRLGRFRALLDVLENHGVIVGLEEFVDGSAPGGGPKVALTFDDAYCGAVTIGAGELARRGLPATIFVSPGLLGSRVFWWDALAEPAGGLPAALRERALDEWRGREDEIAAGAPELFRDESRIPPYARSGTEAELRKTADFPSIRLASHTWSHPNLARLETSELGEELQRSLAWLRERFANVDPWLSYPYGLSSPAVRDATRDAGYRAAFRIDGGHLRPGDDAFALPRLNVPAGLSPHGLELRVAGLLT